MLSEREYLLTTLCEECVEVAKRACKAMRFGLYEIQPNDNRRRLELELADLMGMVKELGLVILDEDIAAKHVKLLEFMEYSRKIGTLEPRA